MEAKKNPVHDVHRLSFRFFMIGLAISVSIAIVAFEWTTEKIPYVAYALDSPIEGYIEVIPYHDQRHPAPAFYEKKIQPRLQNFTSADLTEVATDNIPNIDIADYSSPEPTSEIIFANPPEDDPTAVIALAEVQPWPVGGFESFYSQISKNLKYPKQAIRHRVDGRVFIEFVVDRNGQINNMKVLKGIGSGCDEEAMRVLALTQWEPGRQRGNPVNVRMVIPVFFKIQ